MKFFIGFRPSNGPISGYFYRLWHSTNSQVRAKPFDFQVIRIGLGGSLFLVFYWSARFYYGKNQMQILDRGKHEV